METKQTVSKGCDTCSCRDNSKDTCNGCIKDFMRCSVCGKLVRIGTYGLHYRTNHRTDLD